MSQFLNKLAIGILHYIGVGQFSASYENDRMPFALGQRDLAAWAGDGDDKCRTAAVLLSYGNLRAGFNLFTGLRTDDSKDDVKVGKQITGDFGENMPNGIVNDTGTPYRVGAAFVGYEGVMVGMDSDRWLRYPIQDNLAHNLPGTRQPGFKTYSKAIRPFG